MKRWWYQHHAIVATVASARSVTHGLWQPIWVAPPDTLTKVSNVSHGRLEPVAPLLAHLLVHPCRQDLRANRLHQDIEGKGRRLEQWRQQRGGWKSDALRLG